MYEVRNAQTQQIYRRFSSLDKAHRFCAYHLKVGLFHRSDKDTWLSVDSSTVILYIRR